MDSHSGDNGFDDFGVGDLDEALPSNTIQPLGDRTPASKTAASQFNKITHYKWWHPQQEPDETLGPLNSNKEDLLLELNIQGGQVDRNHAKLVQQSLK